MDKVNDGGPAFPHGIRIQKRDTYGGGEWEESENFQPGATLRDYFAAKALPSLMHDLSPDVAVKQAYLWADAMIKARA